MENVNRRSARMFNWVQVMATAIPIWMICLCRSRRDHALRCRAG